MAHRVMLVFGTRPEAIKMAPVAAALAGLPSVEVLLTVTAQHREMLDPVLELFGLVPDEDLDVMAQAGDMPDVFARMVSGVSRALAHHHPDLVLVHGDTNTTLATALAAFYGRTRVAHVEAGLRTGNIHSPWPEEANRRLTTPLCDLHFAPTATARDNLLAEGVSPDAIHVTGNTVIDALLMATRRLEHDSTLRSRFEAQFGFLQPGRRVVLVTGHRRENFGGGLEAICSALRDISGMRDVDVVYPVHLNPAVRMSVRASLADVPGVHLIEPLDYLPFVYLMGRSHLILTDSGGVQEEAPALGKPVLVLRSTTERPEAVEAGTVRLVGTSRETIVTETLRLLDDDSAHAEMARASNPYGDGEAAGRIAAVVARTLQESRAASQAPLPQEDTR